MPKALTKVIYKPDVTANAEYTCIVNPEEVSSPIQYIKIYQKLSRYLYQFKKWKEGVPFHYLKWLILLKSSIPPKGIKGFLENHLNNNLTPISAPAKK
ncbi:hypothetical protein DXG01_006037 [Tephrocybe rancida]|nr:hypothetical protein DXG01_006037 [Tephrocybe rancida]